MKEELPFLDNNNLLWGKASLKILDNIKIIITEYNSFSL